MAVRSSGGSTYWKINLCQICEFVLKQDEKTLEIVKAGHVCTNDPFLCVKSDVGVCPAGAG